MNARIRRMKEAALTLGALLSLSGVAALGDPLIPAWSRSYTGLGGAEGRGVTVSPEGIYVTGITWPSGGDWHTWDIYLLKYDLGGNLLWTRTWGGTNYEDGGRVSASGSHVCVAGQTYSYAYDPAGGLEADAVTVCWAHDGVLDCSNSPDCWFTRFSGDSGYYGPENGTDIAHDDAGNFYVSGYSERVYGNYWAFAEKYDDTGAKQWHQHWGGSGYLKMSFASGLALSGDAVYVGGASNQYSVNYQVMALKYMTDGALVWSNLWGDSGTGCYAADMAVDGADLYATGYRGDDANPSAWDTLVVKLHDDGSSASYVGSTTFSTPGRDFGRGITVGNGRVYVVGTTTPEDNGDAILLVYDTDLNQLWQRTWASTSDDAAHDVAYSDGMLFVTGNLGGVAFLDAYEVDIDEDGVDDKQDNCAADYNPGQEDSDGDGLGDACDPCFNATAPIAESTIPDAGFGTRVRYLGFQANPDSAGKSQAIRVTLTDLPVPFEYAEGRVMWVGAPYDVSEVAGKPDSTPPTFKLADLQCDPFFADWTQFGVVYVRSESFVPLGLYDLQAIDNTCAPENELDYSGPLPVTLSRWGDAVGTNNAASPQGTVDFNDISSVVDKFKGLPGAPSKSRADVAPSLPDKIVDFQDIPSIVDAFRGLAYPYAGPPVADPCP